MKRISRVGLSALMAVVASQAHASLVSWSGGGFTMLESGFTAEVVATNSGFLGGVAFAPDGDILSDNCAGSGSPLHRWDVQGATANVHGSNIYSETTYASNAGCGLITHSNGSLYTNTYSALVKLDPDSGAVLNSLASGGNALGVAEDPLTGNVYWVGNDQTIKVADAALTTILDSSFANNGGFTDGIFWNPDGSLLYTTDRTNYTVDIFDRSGNLVNSVAIGHEPDGIAFMLGGTVLTNNTDGTISQIDSLGNVSLFASGGFRGDLAHVGPDGAWYITQDGTRYADGTTEYLDSIVRISAVGGGGFLPPPGTDHTPVPEPATLALMAIGIAGLGFSRGRKRV